MVGWHRKTWDDGMDAFTPTMKVQDALSDYILRLSQRGLYFYDVAVFSDQDPETGEITIYFSPTAEPIAKMFGAIPCEKPIPRENFSLSVGDERAKEIHFPSNFG